MQICLGVCGAFMYSLDLFTTIENEENLMMHRQCRAKSLAPLAVVLVLAAPVTWGADLTAAPVQVDTIDAIVTEDSWVGPVMATTVGAVSGVVVYSLITGDWSWTMGLFTMGPVTTGLTTTTAVAAAPAGAVGAVATGTTAAATGAAIAGAPSVVRPLAAAAVPGVTGAAGAATAGAAARLGATWANKWPITAASGLTGALLGNLLYNVSN